MESIKLQKTYPIIAALIIVLTITASVAMINYHEHDAESYTYIPSNIGYALTTVDEVTQGAASFATTDISKVKDQVDHTIKGTVVSISEPITWTEPTPKSEGYFIRNGENVKIEIDIEVDETSKSKIELDAGSIVTVTITGKLLDNKLKLDGGEEQYEIGERVIVHIAEDPNEIIGKNVKYVKLGQFGKYKIHGDKAYNELYTEGRNISSIMSETKN